MANYVRKILGFGTVKGPLTMGGEIINAVELRFGSEARISSIECNVIDVAPLALLAFNVAQVFVIQGQLFDVNGIPDPYNANKWIDTFSGAAANGPDISNPLFEHRWGGIYNADRSKRFYFGPKGLELKKATTYTVFMPIPATNDLAPPGGDDQFVSLTVRGFQYGAKDPFPELR